MNRSLFLRGVTLTKTRGLGYLLSSLLIEIAPFRLMVRIVHATINSLSLRHLLGILSGVHANQLWGERTRIFEHIVSLEVSKSNSRALEIGTWFGAGSTQLILKHLASDGQFYSVDSWSAEADLGKSAHPSMAAKRMSFETLNAWLYSSISLFRSAQKLPKAKLIQIRAKSEDLREMFSPDFKFDLIYIDGSHLYKDIMIDLDFALRNIKAGGLICGDDLDLGLDEKYFNLAKENLESDLVVLPDGKVFHPGVLAAVSKYFTKVDSENGFWWVRP
jgi:predicted O-methyltransferase YrrM